MFGYLLRLGHLTALGVWVGGLVVLALAWLLPRAPRPAQLIASFSPVAAAAMGVIVTTGLAMSAREVSTVTALLGTWFGKALLAKLVVLALALVLAVVQRKRLRSGRTSSVPAAIEAVLAIAIVVGGVAMSASAPAQGIRFTGPNSPAPPSQRSTVLEGLTVQIGIQPNRPGANDLTVLVLDPRRPSPTPVAGATVSLASTNGTNESRQSSVAANKTTDLGQVQIGGAGQLNVMVTVTRQGAAPLVTAVPWTVGSYVPPRAKTIVSDARLGSWLALAATLVGAVSLGLLVRGRRRPGRPPTAPPDGPPEADQTETDLPIALQDASAGPITLD